MHLRARAAERASFGALALHRHQFANEIRKILKGVNDHCLASKTTGVFFGVKFIHQAPSAKSVRCPTKVRYSGGVARRETRREKKLGIFVSKAAGIL